MEMGWKSCGAIDLYVDDGEQVYIHIHTHTEIRRNVRRIMQRQ